LQDMGFTVNKLKLYSMDDNKSYPIDKPEDDSPRFDAFEALLLKIRQFDLHDDFVANPKKCRNCIYNNLCDMAELEPC